MDWGSFGLGFGCAVLLWFVAQVGRATERRELRERLQRQEGVPTGSSGLRGSVDKL